MNVFLCHSSTDKPFTRELARRLRDCGVSVWVDESEIQVGDSLIERIGSAIDSVDYVAAIISINSVRSEWVNRELRIATTREIDEKKTIVIPIILSDVPLPPFLRDKLYADFSDRSTFEAGFAALSRVFGFNYGDAERESDFGVTLHSISHKIHVIDKLAKEALWYKTSRFTPMGSSLKYWKGEHFHSNGNLEFLYSRPGRLLPPRREGGGVYLTTEFDPPLPEDRHAERTIVVKCIDSFPDDVVDILWIPTNNMDFMDFEIITPTERPIKSKPTVLSLANSNRYDIDVPIYWEKNRARVKIENPSPGVKYLFLCPW